MLQPARDEAEALPQVLAAIPRPDDAAFRVREVVVVDNGSRDGTAGVARALGATVVREPRCGYGSACLAGLARLRLDPPEVVAFMDADGSDDLVIGSRVLGEAEAGALTPLQRFGNALATRLLRVCFGARHTDLGPFRAVRWAALERLGMRDRGFGWTVEMQARAARARLRVEEVPVRCRRRAAGRWRVSGTLRGAVGAGIGILVTILRVRLGD